MARKELTLVEFKAKHALSNNDMLLIVGKELAYDSKTKHSPHHIELCNKIDVVVDRMKLNNGIFTDTDAQHAAHIIELQNKKIVALEAEVMRLTPSKIQQTTPKSKQARIPKSPKEIPAPKKKAGKISKILGKDK